jgi:hypothetical protein
MKDTFYNIPLPDKEKFLKWLETQPWLREVSPQEGFAIVLYKLYQMERTLETIARDVKTHWVE